MGAEPPLLSDYAFLSDCTTAALVSSAGSVDWWCVPRFDSPAVFGRLLDPDAGHWSISVDGASARRDYVGESLVLRTELTAPGGTAVLSEALAFEHGARDHDIGLRSPRTLVRRIEATAGEVVVRVEVAPRMEYGLTVPQWHARDGRWSAGAGPATLVLTGLPANAAETDGTLRADVRLRAGESMELQLTHVPTYPPAPGTPSPADIADTLAGWESWAAHHGYDGKYAEAVRRSAVVLQGLTYAPSGAVVAAATTSLPEHPGGVANWDYRFAWVRDISFTLQALWVAACPDEADRFFRWLAHAAGRGDSDESMQIMYGVEGERDLTERLLPHLRGYQDSRPVRAGNDAWRQRQFDILGEVLLAADLLEKPLGDLDEELQRFLAGLADAAAKVWREPDSGMWETRDGDRHHTSSKVMCWVALDRAVAMADRLGGAARAEEWRRARDELHATVLREAWSERAGAFTGVLGEDELDASVLLLPLVGFVAADDDRMLRTLDAVRDRLGDGPFVRRWRDEPGGFLLCSYWLVECLARAGRADEARERFEALQTYANDLGLLAEMVDPRTGDQWGNTPQAFSHVGLINAAWALTEASSATR